jgi:ribosomal protein L21
MAMGLIAAALGGAGKALSSIGEIEAKKQNEAKLRKELMDMESEEKLRLDDIMFQRKQQRAIPEAQTAAKANVAGQVTTLDERSKTNLPALEAQSKVANVDAELAAMSKAGIYDKQAKAKYDALNAEIDAAEKSGYDVKEARRTANALKAKFDAEETAGIPKLQANKDATQRLENVRALVEKNVVKEEADLLAKQELAKVQAMTAQGVPEAEAKLLSAKWKAQKTQRDEAAAEKTQQEMNDLITKMKDPNYKKAMITREGIDATGSLILQANRDSKEKKDRERNTIEMERQIKETEKEMGRILGIGDPKKIPDEINYLESQAKKNDANAIAKLAKIKPLTDELNSLSKELRTYKRSSSGSSSSSGADTYKVGEERTLSDGANKGKTVVWDGTRWNLKK